MNLSKSIELALINKGIKKSELAVLMNVRRTHVSTWIRSGTMTMSNLVKMCGVFGMPVSEFIALGEK